MKTRLLNMSGRHAVFAFLALLAVTAARADEADPPGRVARLAAAEGSVSLQPAGVEEWTSANLNRPLTTGDKLWTDQSSRAELDAGSVAIRLGATTGFSLLNLDDSTAQMQVTAGTLIVRVRNMQGNQTYEVDTPNLALSLQQPGEYRVEVNDAGDTTVVKVSQGQAQAAGGGQSVAIGAQQTVRFIGTDTLALESGTLGAPDDLDSWSAGRERQLQDSPSRQYVADDVAGTQDLDTNGRWESTPDYGYVWTPTVVEAGWAPYRFGHWVWIAPWGWTWVDDAPWGYAPFHYGRWVTYNSSWCWVPGPRRLRPVYAPALVAWVGGSAGGVSVAIGRNVGWFPLAPREVFVPAYHVSPTYVRNVNVTNTTIVNNTYITNVYQNNVTNIHYVNNTAGAVTAVPHNVFISGQRVSGRDVRLPGGALAGTTVSAAAPAIVPARQSLLGPNGAHNVVRPPAGLLERPVMARTAPPRAPVPFERQVAAIKDNGGRPLARADLARLQPAQVATPVRMVAPGGTVVSAGTLPRGSRAPGASASPASGGPSSLTERERVLQNSRPTPAPRSDRPAAAREEAPGSSPRAAQSAPAPRVDRPAATVREDAAVTPRPARSAPVAPQESADRPPSTPQRSTAVQPYVRPQESQPQERADRPPSAPQRSTAPPPPQPYVRPQASQSQEQRYRTPVPAAPPPPPSPAPQRAAPSPPPASPPQAQRPASPPSPPQAQRPAPPPRQEAKGESREGGPHGDRNSRDRGDR